MRRLKKFLTLIISCIVTLAVLFSCSGCVRAQELKLAKIPTSGNYIMRSGLFLNQGNTVVDIKEEIRKKIMKEKFVLADDVDHCYTQSVERGGVIYFVMKYTAKNREYNNEILKSESDNYYAFGYTPIFGVDVKIVDYFTLRVNSMSGSYIGLFGDYFVLHFGERDNPKYVVYNIETLERVPFDAEGYIYQICNDEVFMLTKNDGNYRYFRFYDENLSVYEYKKERDGLAEIFYGEYLMFYARNESEEIVQAVRYKTKEVLDSAESLDLYRQWQTLQSNNNIGFEYQGKRYKYESEETYDLIPTGEFDENGEEIIKSVAYTTVTFTDVSTDEKYETTNLKLFERLPNMQDIQKIYNVQLNRVGIYLQDGELYFLFWCDDSFFGITTSKTTPKMVYKYDDNSQLFEYIGFAYRGIDKIYEGVL